MNAESLCWRCSKSQGFYESPCPHCGSTNPNVDFEKALAECDSTYIREAGSQPADVGISGSGPTENVENGCSQSISGAKE